MVETAADALGSLGIVVNKAETTCGMTVEDMKTEDYQTTMETDVDRMFLPPVRPSPISRSPQ